MGHWPDFLSSHIEVRASGSLPGLWWWWLVSTHFLVGLNDSRCNGLYLKLHHWLVRALHGIHRDDIQLVRTADHHEARGYVPRELVDATTVDLHAPVGTQVGTLPRL